jgi:hypothetical protein
MAIHIHLNASKTKDAKTHDLKESQYASAVKKIEAGLNDFYTLANAETNPEVAHWLKNNYVYSIRQLLGDFRGWKAMVFPSKK